MNSYNLFEYLVQEDENKHVSDPKEYHLPFNESVIEGGSMLPQHVGVELVAILSSN